MSEKPDPRTRLVAETFADDWASGPAATFALRAAAHARRRRTVRLVALGGSLATAAIAAVFVVVRPSTSAPAVPSVSTTPLSPTVPSAAAPLTLATPLGSKVSPAFELISDDELFAELRGRPVLILPQEPEGRRIVVLAR
ncbi:MAG: hypothetical protein NTV51_32165 [Verrucomicrobia bacterium]|nr:hypothetical protein [Verrucomicrobiota bacterium]